MENRKVFVGARQVGSVEATGSGGWFAMAGTSRMLISSEAVDRSWPSASDAVRAVIEYDEGERSIFHGPSQEWLDGYQAALEAMDGVVLPKGIAVLWSKDPAVRAAAVARHEDRARKACTL